MSTSISVAELPIERYAVRGAWLAVASVDAVGPPGEPVLLVPGYTGSKQDFAALAEPVTRAGYRHLAMDQRGQHESTGPEDPGGFAVEALAADLVSLVSALGAGPVHLVGHSFGGLVARAAVIASPSSFRSVTLMGSGPAAIAGRRAAEISALAPVLDEGGLAAVFAAKAALDAADPGYAPPPAEVAAFLRRRYFAASPVGVRVMGEALLSEPDRVAELRQTGVPVLVLYGDGDDAWLPATQAEMAARVGAALAVIPDALHSPAAEQPALTAAALVSFWTSLR